MNVNVSMSYELSQNLDQRGYKGQMALGYLDAINDLMKIEDRRYRDQPQLNENQQIAINNAKKSFEKGADLYDCAIDMMLYDGLTDKEWAKATVVFLLWALEQETE
ncbi:hypothetical protein ABE901_13765 [Enterococcus casseliflavus]|uniref:hypothetical protein n=1 Tax=Enterococcus casseliflavus TaxID=37734 RepID=UPI003D6B00A6